MSHPRHQTNQTDKTQFEVPPDPLWLSNLRNELGCSNSRLQLLATGSFFSHTATVPEGDARVCEVRGREMTRQQRN